MHRGIFGLGVLGLTVLGLTVGCSPPASAPAPEVWFYRCEDVIRGGPSEPWTCVLHLEAELSLWMPPSVDNELEIRLDDRLLVSEPVPSADGRLYPLRDLTAGRLRVSVPSQGPGAEWNLDLKVLSLPSELLRARELQRKSPAVARELATVAMEKAATSRERAHSLSILGRIERHVNRPEAAEQHFLEALGLFTQSGNVTNQIDILTMLFSLRYYKLDDHPGSLQYLEDLPPSPPGDAGTLYLASFFRGQAAVNSGNAREASHYLAEAAKWSDRFQVRDFWTFVQQMRAPLLNQLGRHGEAVELLTELNAESRVQEDPCDRAQLIHNLAWNQLLTWSAWGGPERAHRMGFPEVADYRPIAHLVQARELSLDDTCDADNRINTQYDLALAFLFRGRTDEATEALDRALEQEVETPPKAWHRIWSYDLRGRIALAEGRARQALADYDRLAELASDFSNPDGSWRAAIGRGRALRALDRPEAALKAYARAEALVERELPTIPFGNDRETSLRARSVGTTEQIELLVELGRVGEALTSARRARIRALRGWVETTNIEGPEQQEIAGALNAFDEGESRDWAVPGQERRDLEAERQAERLKLLDRAHLSRGGDGALEWPLAQLDPEEVVLLYRPAAEGWIGFAAHRGEIVAGSIELPGAGSTESPSLDRRDLSPSTAWSNALLQPFADQLEGGKLVRVLVDGYLSRLDFHALPFGDGPLIAQMPVVYGLDLPVAATDEPSSGRDAFLLVVDPRRNLPGAAREGDRVQAVVEQRFAGGVVRLDHEQATLDAFREALSTAGRLHFAGHGDFSGTGGWDSGLALAHNTRLTVPSLLALESSPRTVVLTACDSAVSADGFDEGLGLAKAWLLTGARQVVGAARPVSDEASQAFSESLYRHWQGSLSLAEAFRRAQLDLRRENHDWAGFRIVER